MKKLIWAIASLSLSLLIAACGKNDPPRRTSVPLPDILQAWVDFCAKAGADEQHVEQIASVFSLQPLNKEEMETRNAYSRAFAKYQDSAMALRMKKLAPDWNAPHRYTIKSKAWWIDSKANTTLDFEIERLVPSDNQPQTTSAWCRISGTTSSISSFSSLLDQFRTLAASLGGGAQVISGEDSNHSMLTITALDREKQLSLIVWKKPIAERLHTAILAYADVGDSLAEKVNAAVPEASGYSASRGIWRPHAYDDSISGPVKFSISVGNEASDKQ